jgi:hypothetical protein
MATTVRLRRLLDSSTLEVPELAGLIGKEVEILVTEIPHQSDEDLDERYPLRGSVLSYDEPFGPASDEKDWEALR